MKFISSPSSSSVNVSATIFFLFFFRVFVGSYLFCLHVDGYFVPAVSLSLVHGEKENKKKKKEKDCADKEEKMPIRASFRKEKKF